MAHLFFSYAHKDFDRLYPIHQQMELTTERMIWIDRIGLQRDMAWADMIERAIQDSYGVIFAITKNFIERPFILEKEIPWAIARFNNTRQGKLLFPIRFDDVPLPDLLTSPDVSFVIHVIDARDGNLEHAIGELARVIPPAQEGKQPFIVSWPRLPNFKGRDQQLIDLHNKLHTADGKAAIKTAGLYGMGGIGKTQLAVEFAYRYRFYFPGGVYWLNAAQDWQRQIVTFADRLGLMTKDESANRFGRTVQATDGGIAIADSQITGGIVNIGGQIDIKGDVSITQNFTLDPDERARQKAFAFERFLQQQGQDALLILDNIETPAGLNDREIAPSLTILSLCQSTPLRLIVTSRVQNFPAGFSTIEVSILSPQEARAVLLDSWQVRTDTPDLSALDAIAKLFGFLPLPLGWMAAALRQMDDLSPAVVIDELRAQSVDAVIQTLMEQGIDLGTPAYYEALVGAALDWQIEQMTVKSQEAKRLLALLAGYPEATIIPRERLRLLSELQDSGLKRPFKNATQALQAYSLAEVQMGDSAYRLHPLTRQYVRRKLNVPERLAEAAPALVTAYRTPAVIEQQTWSRGFGAVLDDLEATRQAVPQPVPELDGLIRLFTLESDKLLTLPSGVTDSYPVQQIRDRAHHQGDDRLRDGCDEYLAGRPHFRTAAGSRYPASRALLRTLRGHTREVTGALVLADGCILSWAQDLVAQDLVQKDHTLRLWDGQGQPLAVLQGHTDVVQGALALADGRVLSWAHDGTLRLWDRQGQPLSVLEGHSDAVWGALALADSRILSWAGDGTLRLWDRQGQPLAVLEGHTDVVRGALTLTSGRFLSWAGDGTLRLWDRQGQPLSVLEGHSGVVQGALALADGNILSWADHTLRLWSEEGQSLAILQGHEGELMGALEMVDGRILSWANDTTLRLWDRQGQSLAVLEGHTGTVKGALEVADARILSWSYDHTLRLWDTQGNLLAVLEGHTGMMEGVLALTDGRFLSWADNPDYTPRLWDGQGQPLGVLQGHMHVVKGALEVAGGRILSWAQNDSTLQLWDAQGQTLAALQGHTHGVRGVLALAGGRILSWAYEDALRLWDGQGKPLAVLHDDISGALALADGRFLSWERGSRPVHHKLLLRDGQGKLLAVLEGHMSEGRGALEMADGRLLSWAQNDSSLRLWDRQGQPLAVFQGHTDTVRGALALADGCILSWAADKTLRLWNDQGKPLAVLRGHSSAVRGALALADGRILSWAYDCTLRLWNGQGKLLAILEGHTIEVMDALALANGHFLSWAGGIIKGENTLRLWNGQGKLLAILEGHAREVRGALALTSGRILSWANDGTLRLWDGQGKPLAILHGHTGMVESALEVAGGRILSWAQNDSTLQLWDAQGLPLALYHTDEPITCCVKVAPGRIVFGDRGGRVVVMDIVG